MTGNGTQVSPYIVTDWNELAQVFPTAQYIELGNDIQAPDDTANLSSGVSTLKVLDGKGYSISGLYTASGNAIAINGNAQYAYQPIIRNISFSNINCQGDSFLFIGGASSVELDNATFSGNVFSKKLINIGGGASSLLKNCGGNIHANSSDFTLISVNYATIRNNKFTLDYGTIAPSPTYSVTSEAFLDNVLFIIRAPENGKLYFKNCRYCSFIGDGNIKILSNYGPNIIADTLNLDGDSTGDNHVLSISDIKNVQVLYDLGFPVSGVIS